jgi:hypothetical protein
MNWLVVLAAVAGSFAVMLVGLRLLAYYRGQVAEKKPRTKPHVEHFDWDEFQTEFTRSDAMVAYADRVWPYILGDRARYVPMLYLVIPAALTSSILVAFGVFAAYVISNGAPFALILLCLIAPLANLAQANFATQASPLNATMAAAVMVLAVFNAGYSFVGASIIGNAMSTAADISAGETNARLARRDQLNASLEKVRLRRAEKGNLPLETLITQEKAARDKQFCESWLGRGRSICPQDKVAAREAGPKCGPRCQGFKSEADNLAAQVADARSEKALQTELASLNETLSDSGFVRTEAAPVAVMGWEARQDTIQIAVVIFVTFLDAVLWLWVGKEAREKRRIYRRQAREAGNLAMVNLGLEPRYAVEDDPHEVAALPAPDKASGDNVTINVESDPMKIIEASDRLSEIHALFGEAMRQDDERAVTFALLRQVYETRAAEKGRKRVMNRMTFQQELRRYLELRSIPHASAKIQGYRLGVDSKPDSGDQPAQEAAE